MDCIVIGIGSNLGDRMKNISNALRELSGRNIKFLKFSSVYQTDPWGNPQQPEFLNLVAGIACPNTPQSLLDQCKEVERKIGRVPSARWGPRVVDIDILYYRDLIFEDEHLKIPHPRIPDRRFNLIALAELFPVERHPALGRTHRDLLKTCQDTSACTPTELTLADL